MMLERKEDQSMESLILLRRGNKVFMGRNTEKKCVRKPEGKAIQRLPTWGSIPYTDTKLRHYCVCQEVLADMSLIELSPERLCQSLTNADVDAHIQPGN